MMQLNLQGNLIKVDHKLKKQEFTDSKLTPEQFQQQVNAQVYSQIVQRIMQKMKITTKENKEGDFEIKGEAFLFTEKDLYNMLLEIAWFNDEEQKQLETTCKTKLGLRCS